MALISVDDHVQEPSDLWTRRLPKGRWGDRIPHVERSADGTDRWLIDGALVNPVQNTTVAFVHGLYNCYWRLGNDHLPGRSTSKN